MPADGRGRSPGLLEHDRDLQRALHPTRAHPGLNDRGHRQGEEGPWEHIDPPSTNAPRPLFCPGSCRRRRTASQQHGCGDLRPALPRTAPPQPTCPEREPASWPRRTACGSPLRESERKMGLRTSHGVPWSAQARTGRSEAPSSVAAIRRSGSGPGERSQEKRTDEQRIVSRKTKRGPPGTTRRRGRSSASGVEKRPGSRAPRPRPGDRPCRCERGRSPG